MALPKVAKEDNYELSLRAGLRLAMCVHGGLVRRACGSESRLRRQGGGDTGLPNWRDLNEGLADDGKDGDLLDRHLGIYIHVLASVLMACEPR